MNDGERLLCGNLTIPGIFPELAPDRSKDHFEAVTWASAIEHEIRHGFSISEMPRRLTDPQGHTEEVCSRVKSQP